MPFRDYFSSQSEQYARHRPVYPAELFDYLAGLAPRRELAWDCGTGNGQAALALADRFQRVIATDASREQIGNAFPHPKIDYRVEQAEETSIAAGSVDLITAGTAVHWFDLDAFYREVRRVGIEGAVIAVWTYHLPVIQPDVDAVLERYYRQTLNGYWPERIQYLEARYRTLPFPFEEIQPPPFSMTAEWNLDNLLGFLASWSATRKYIQETGRHPFDEILADLRYHWSDAAQVRHVEWPLHFRIGKIKQVG